MAYVDLKPIRAGITDTPLNSKFTFIRQRLDELAQRKDLRESDATLIPPFYFRSWGLSGRIHPAIFLSISRITSISSIPPVA